jgi:predicted RNase H-like nuclease (RuvC/YqgF family)
MLDQLPDWVGPAVAALIAGVFGTLAALAKGRADNEAREDERLEKAVASYYAAIRCDVDKLHEDVERQRLRIRELETALAMRTNELTELRDQHDALKLDYTDLSQHVEELRAMLTQEGRDVPPLPRPRRPRRGGGE